MGEGLRIGFVSLHTSPIASPGSADAGGMNVVELNAALALAAAGHQVDLITRRDHPGEPAVEQLAEGVRLLNLDAGPPHPMAKSASEELIEPFRAAMARLPGNYDVIHSHHWFSGVAALPLARQWRLPHVQSFHSVAAPSGSTSLADGEPAESPGRVAGEALSARESDLVIAVSHAERRAVELRYHRFDGIDVVHPGVDTEQFHPLRAGQRHWAWDDTGGCYFLFAARLQPLKGPDLAIRMMAEIPEYDRPQLIVAGEASADFADYEASLHALVGELGLTDKVTFLARRAATSWPACCAAPARSSTRATRRPSASSAWRPRPAACRRSPPAPAASPRPCSTGRPASCLTTATPRAGQRPPNRCATTASCASASPALPASSPANTPGL